MLKGQKKLETICDYDGANLVAVVALPSWICCLILCFLCSASLCLLITRQTRWKENWQGERNRTVTETLTPIVIRVKYCMPVTSPLFPLWSYCQGLQQVERTAVAPKQGCRCLVRFPNWQVEVMEPDNSVLNKTLSSRRTRCKADFPRKGTRTKLIWHSWLFCGGFLLFVEDTALVVTKIWHRWLFCGGISLLGGQIWCCSKFRWGHSALRWHFRNKNDQKSPLLALNQCKTVGNHWEDEIFLQFVIQISNLLVNCQ